MEGELNELALRFRWFAGDAAASPLYQKFAPKIAEDQSCYGLASALECIRTAMDPNLKPFFSRGGK